MSAATRVLDFGNTLLDDTDTMRRFLSFLLFFPSTLLVSQYAYDQVRGEMVVRTDRISPPRVIYRSRNDRMI